MIDRPYCLNELKALESYIHSKYRLSNVFAEHYPCSHRYRVKRGGKKEQHILDLNETMLDDQTCSVCFKLRTNDDFSNDGHVIDDIRQRDGKDVGIDVGFIRNKLKFYKWLFQHDY
jgi:hypothetical protein